MLLSFIILTITFAPVQSVWSLSLNYLPLSRRRVLYRSRSCPPFESQAAEFARSILRAWNCRHIVNFTRRRRILRVRAIGRNCSLLDENKIASEAADSSLSLFLFLSTTVEGRKRLRFQILRSREILSFLRLLLVVVALSLAATG